MKNLVALDYALNIKLRKIFPKYSDSNGDDDNTEEVVKKLAKMNEGWFLKKK